MFYVFLIAVAVLGVGVYLTLIMRLVPGAAEERLGVLEALPPDVGVWKSDAPPYVDGLVRQVRLFHQPSAGLFSNERLLRQVRYRHAGTSEIFG